MNFILLFSSVVAGVRGGVMTGCGAGADVCMYMNWDDFDGAAGAIIAPVVVSSWL